MDVRSFQFRSVQFQSPNTILRYRKFLFALGEVVALQGTLGMSVGISGSTRGEEAGGGEEGRKEGCRGERQAGVARGGDGGLMDE